MKTLFKRFFLVILFLLLLNVFNDQLNNNKSTSLDFQYTQTAKLNNSSPSIISGCMLTDFTLEYGKLNNDTGFTDKQMNSILIFPDSSGVIVLGFKATASSGATIKQYRVFPSMDTSYKNFTDGVLVLEALYGHKSYVLEVQVGDATNVNTYTFVVEEDCYTEDKEILFLVGNNNFDVDTGNSGYYSLSNIYEHVTYMPLNTQAVRLNIQYRYGGNYDIRNFTATTLEQNPVVLSTNINDYISFTSPRDVVIFNFEVYLDNVLFRVIESKMIRADAPAQVSVPNYEKSSGLLIDAKVSGGSVIFNGGEGYSQLIDNSILVRPDSLGNISFSLELFAAHGVTLHYSINIEDPYYMNTLVPDSSPIPFNFPSIFSAVIYVKAESATESAIYRFVVEQNRQGVNDDVLFTPSTDYDGNGLNSHGYSYIRNKYYAVSYVEANEPGVAAQLYSVQTGDYTIRNIKVNGVFVQAFAAYGESFGYELYNSSGYIILDFDIYLYGVLYRVVNLVIFREYVDPFTAPVTSSMLSVSVNNQAIDPSEISVNSVSQEIKVLVDSKEDTVNILDFDVSELQGLVLVNNQELTSEMEFTVGEYEILIATPTGYKIYKMIIDENDITVIPEDPNEPSDPSDPSEPTDPNEPSDPSEPTDPNEPSDPSEPTDPNESEEPGESTDPNEPSDPNDPANLLTPKGLINEEIMTIAIVGGSATLIVLIILSFLFYKQNFLKVIGKEEKNLSKEEKRQR